MIDLRVRPITEWPGDRTPPGERRDGPFKAAYDKTLRLLQKELAHLEARSTVIEAGFNAADIRNDGWPYAGRNPGDPGVIVAFGSKFGPIKISCDHFRRYQDNIRAIGMHLEHLRLSSIYGVGTRGEQYKGYLQLEAPKAPSQMSVDEAAALLGTFISLSADDLLDGGAQELADAFKIAARRTHPDRGGSMDEFYRINEAKRILDEHFSRMKVGAA